MQFVVNAAEKLRHGNVKRLLLLLLLLLPLLPLVSSVCFLGWFVKRFGWMRWMLLAPSPRIAASLLTISRIRWRADVQLQLQRQHKQQSTWQHKIVLCLEAASWPYAIINYSASGPEN